MPRAKAKGSSVKPDGLYVCWQSGSVQVGDETLSFSRGQRLKGDNPVVLAVPQWFHEDGVPADQVPSQWDEVVRRHEAENPPAVQVDAFLVDQPRPLERQDTVVLTRSVTIGWGRGGTKGSATFDRGAVFPARCELAAALPDAFEPSDVQFTKRAA